MFRSLKFKITGAAPLLCHSGDLANPMNPISRELKKITGKRDKKEADQIEMARLEFLGGLYLKDKKPFVPADLLHAMMIESAKKVRLGKQAAAGLICSDGELIYDGPTTPDELWDDERFRFVTGVRVQRNRIMRTRPMFKDWQCSFEVEFNDELLNEADVKRMVETAGAQIGLGDWRPRYGRFEVAA